MESIDGDVAKYIWGFFLDFDETGLEETGTIAADSTPPPVTAFQQQHCQECLPGNSSEEFRDRCLDFRSIRSLRSVNKFFRDAFDELSGWSCCAIAMKREYLFLKNIKSFQNWNLARQRWASPSGRSGADGGTAGGWTPERRKEAAAMVSRAMEQKKAAVLRRNKILRLLDRGPFTKEEKRLTYEQVCIIQ
mmetsp:Transcript_34100/g.80262  ORF Transcript_34100/g.80262 Transcript_34100/m.80262 type:complete len:191 (-) Transcript_34100:63-635(-)